MDIFVAVIQLLGGLAMFLYGIEVMGDGLKNSTGAALKRVLEKVTGNVLIGVLTGTLVTAVIQSSTATIVLTVALIGAGMLTLKQATSIVLGANIGTTITAQLIRLMDIEAGDNFLLLLCKPDTLAPIALVVGIVLIMFVKKKSSKSVGDIFIGFGILFVGLMNMTAAVEPLSQTEGFRSVLAQMNNPILGLVAGMILTVVVQSSSAMVGMLQALSVSGTMTFSMTYPIIMGINIGTCVTTAMVCSIGTSKDAKRTGFVHIVFNLIGTALFMIALSVMKRLGVFGAEFWNAQATSGSIANFQTVFNLITAVVLLPFTGWLVSLSKKAIRDDTKLPAPGRKRIPELDTKLYISPAVAVYESTKAASEMGIMAKENFCKSCNLLVEYDEEIVQQIEETECQLDDFADSVGHFLVGLSKVITDDANERQVDFLMQTVPDFERIGDYATNLVELAEKMHKTGDQFSNTALREIRLLSDAVGEILDTTLAAFANDDDLLARKVEPLEEVIDDMVMILRERHTERLKTGNCNVTSGLVYTDVLTYMERASDQCSSVAVMMLARKNKQVLQNHYAYLRQLHSGSDPEYLQEERRQREKYIAPLREMQ